MASPTVVVVQHIGCETLGIIQHSLDKAGLAARTVRIHDGDPVPASLGDACGLVVMGGPMSVYDHERLPHLKEEMRLIGSALGMHRPVLGICLGSQLLAHVLGSQVVAGRKKEIGWHRVALANAAREDPLWSDFDAEFPAFHWHGDVFDLPPRSQCLASSELTPCQAFRAETCAYGILFHMEVTADSIDGMAAAFPGELAEGGGTRETLARDTREFLPKLSRLGGRFFDGWASRAAEAAGS